jgi:hypothetical protein
MSFLDSQINLTRTIFSASNYQFAREFLTSAITRHQPSWLNEPIGPLRTYWLGNGLHQVCYLIDLAWILSKLQGNVTAKSTTLLIEKFRGLLRAQPEEQFEELLTELQVAGLLSERVSPLAFEPLVPEESIKQGARPKSPDFAFRLPDTDVFVEVTVIRIGVLDKWDRRMRNLTAVLASDVQKRQLRRAIKLVFPISAASRDLSVESRRDLLFALRSSERGEWKTDEFGEPAIVRWIPFPHVNMDRSGAILDSSDLENARIELDLQPGEIAATFGPVDTQAVGTWSSLLPDESLNQLVLKSIRNSLDQKRRQFRHEAPYLLVVKIGHYRLIAGAVQDLITSRIWPNDDYAWMLGICFFTPRRGFLKSDASPSIRLNLNPQARIKPTSTLIEVFEGRREFHI